MFLFEPQRARGSSWTWETPVRIKALSSSPLSHTCCTESRHGTETLRNLRLIPINSTKIVVWTFVFQRRHSFYFRFGPAPLASVKKRKLTAVYGQRRPQKDEHREQVHRDSESEPLLGENLKFIRFCGRSVLPASFLNWSSLFPDSVCSLLHSRPLVNHRRLQLTPTCWPALCLRNWHRWESRYNQRSSNCPTNCIYLFYHRNRSFRFEWLKRRQMSPTGRISQAEEAQLSFLKQSRPPGPEGPTTRTPLPQCAQISLKNSAQRNRIHFLLKVYPGKRLIN